MSSAPQLPSDLPGPRVVLTPIRPEHRGRLREIHGTPEVARWWKQPDADWPAPEPGTTAYAVLLDGAVIGFVQWYHEPEPEYRHAGIDLFLDPAVHGRGLGTEVVRVLCAHLVDDHGFHRIVIDPEAANAAAIACYRKVGFRDVGVMREYYLGADGVWRDGLMMELLARELVR
ncbi:GNAT family N-acetyltransferase [Prescottella sp. R16]|uniref:GNAT family N-acetyltransferase n=1 Tax=Prescottella sp. R16 TaxID=3064529 RepID=UPI00272EC614|nr:GNAT family protein [Prescottella sp. R16]